MVDPEIERIATLPEIYVHNQRRIESAVNIGDYQGAKEINEFLYSLAFNVVVDANEDMRKGRTGGLDNETFNQSIEPWKDILETLRKQGEVIADKLT